MPVESLGIVKIDSVHYYVHDLERSRKLFVDQLDFAEIGGSSPQMEERGRQRSRVFQAGDIMFVFMEPTADGSRAARFLNKHPEGIGTIVFEVEDADRAFALLEAREGTMMGEVETFTDDGGSLKTFSITTPFGDCTFRFVERNGYSGIFPGFVAHAEPKGGNNKFGFGSIDHITSNFPTLAPALLWMEHVMGFERYWKIKFHTDDVAGPSERGSGLKSVVMWDPHSGVKFANNEPMRPNFRQSQISLFTEDLRGSGVQHTALSVPDILPTVTELRERGIDFMPTPGAYYDALPQRIQDSGILRIDEDIEHLRRLEVLIDGEAEHKYLLQIFLKEAAGLHDDPEAGPFFLEIIQRKGDNGFGGGNFRALFESIEREQRAAGRID
jgi:4-hydroxyphenylpyruvate dioxygenase